MAARPIAIGDIHGCLDALAALIDAIEPQQKDTIITLGDHIDRGPNSKGVIDRLIALGKRCKLVALMGDHEEMMLDAINDLTKLRRWLNCGGVETLRSYGWRPGSPKRALKGWIPDDHQKFLNDCRPFYEISRHLFVHAGYLPELPIDKQPMQALWWRVTDAATAKPHSSGKIAIVGHTAQLSGEVLDLGFLICIDTNCVRGGWLTALDVESRQIWEADRKGHLKRRSN
jgi:serine/threonine protein phosphatase 1